MLLAQVSVLRLRVETILGQKNPLHLDHLPRMIANNDGNELVFYQNMLKKYRLNEATFFAADGLPEGVPALVCSHKQ